jgi:hypothetical protein
MEAEVPSFVPILLLAGAGVLVLSFLTFDRLVRAQYEFHREAWMADGQPRGFFWRAPGCNWFASSVALHRLSLTWLFSTPTWATESPTYRALLKRLRLLVVVWNVLFIGGFMVFITSLA